MEKVNPSITQWPNLTIVGQVCCTYPDIPDGWSSAELVLWFPFRVLLEAGWPILAGTFSMVCVGASSIGAFGVK